MGAFGGKPPNQGVVLLFHFSKEKNPSKQKSDTKSGIISVQLVIYRYELMIDNLQETGNNKKFFCLRLDIRFCQSIQECYQIPGMSPQLAVETHQSKALLLL